MAAVDVEAAVEKAPLSALAARSSKLSLTVTQSSGPTLKIPSPAEVTFDLHPHERVCGATTAPVFQDERTRGFSFGSGAFGKTYNSNVRESGRRYKYVRQNTVSGDPELREFPRVFTRAISRTYTLNSATSSSIPVEEWRPIFDKLDESLDGKTDGRIPVEEFKKMLCNDPLWVGTVPKDVQEHILNNVDKNKDGVIDFEEFLELVSGRGMGFGRRKRRAFRELLKQTVEFIVPYKYSYQNQYSCSPPPFFMIVISLLQLITFVYNTAVLHKKLDYIGLNGPVPFCSRLIYNPDKREEERCPKLRCLNALIFGKWKNGLLSKKSVLWYTLQQNVNSSRNGPFHIMTL
jgi:hypothetical protein